MDLPEQPHNADQAASARQFLAAFRAASGSGDPLRLIATDEAGFGAALAQAPSDLARVLADDVRLGPAGPAFVHGAAFASAACDREGRLILADAAFSAWVLPHSKLRASLSRFDPRRASISFLVEDRGRFVAVAAAPLAHSRNWPLDLQVRACLETGRGEIAVLARIDPTGSGSTGTPISRSALGLTGLETRVCDALVRTGSARGAGEGAGVSYETARDALKSAMKKAGVRSQSELVALLVHLNSGEIAAPALDLVLRDVFGLTERQARVALAAAGGASRSDVARAAAVSEHTVKTELAALFDVFAVDSAAGFSRAIAQIRALTALSAATAIELLGPDAASEPLRLLPRKGRPGRIAFSDHGPVSASPVLIIHTATTGRHLPPAHVAHLQQLGFRPVSFDRPGTGLTDLTEGHLLEETARDMVDILDALGIERACVIARGGSMVLATFAARHGDRLLRAVSLNPEPRLPEDRSMRGFVGTVKRVVASHPAMLESLANHLAHRAAGGTVATLIERALRASPADTATLAEPGMLAAYVRASQQSALQGGAGFIAIARTEPVSPDLPLADGSAITILSGTEDPLYQLEDGLSRWTAMWPGCTVCAVPGAGRLLQFQRPDLIAKALLGQELPK